MDEVLNKSQIAGRYSLSYEPENLASGIYFLNMNTKSLDGIESFSKTQKITLLKFPSNKTCNVRLNMQLAPQGRSARILIIFSLKKHREMEFVP